MSVTAARRKNTSSRTRGPLRHPVLRAFLGAPSGVASLVVLAVLLLNVVLAPHFFGAKALETDFTQINAPPSWSHLLGTDTLGRDTLARLLVGGRLSLMLGLVPVACATCVGLPLGMSTAILRPLPRQAVRRGIDAMLSFPVLLIAIFVTVVMGRGEAAPVVGIGFAFSFGIARLTSNLVLGVMDRDFVNAARALGVSRRSLVLRHTLPNIAEPIIINIAQLAAAGVIVASALSFLGLGVQAPSIDWGSMLSTGVRSIYLTPAAALGPALAIAITAMAFGFFGEAVARAINPLLWTASKRSLGENAPRPVVASAQAWAAPAIGEDADPAVHHRATSAVLDVHDLVVSFPGAHGSVEVVKGVTFSLAPGERLGIVGESGGGKSMLGLAIAQLTPSPGKATGRIVLNGKELGSLSKSELDRTLVSDLAFVFQDPMSSLNPALTIGRQLTEGVRIHRGMSRRDADLLAQGRLRDVHIPAPARQMHRRPYEFSGGMRQRALIAMALMTEPALLIADEPTTALDVTIQAQIMDLLDEINRAHQTAIIFISHNLALISTHCDRVLVMYAGRIVEEISAAALATAARHPYTQALLGAAPDTKRITDNEKIRFRNIPGESPDIAAPPSGCAFHPRCPLATERCQTERPQLLHRGGRDRVACHYADANTALAANTPNVVVDG